MGAGRHRRSQVVGPSTLRHVDRVPGILRGGGFTIEMSHHALRVLGSRVGFTQARSTTLPATPTEAPPPEVARAFAGFSKCELRWRWPRGDGASAAATTTEFAFSLDLILDGPSGNAPTLDGPGRGQSWHTGRDADPADGPPDDLAAMDPWCWPRTSITCA
jgi:hypothetical protein